MTSEEREFLRDVKAAVSNYTCTFRHYYEDDCSGNRMFCVDVTVDFDEWGEGDPDEIWDALMEVVLDWNGNDIIDSDMNTYYVGYYID